jgi:hypothetical protein
VVVFGVEKVGHVAVHLLAKLKPTQHTCVKKAPVHLPIPGHGLHSANDIIMLSITGTNESANCRGSYLYQTDELPQQQ